MSFSPAYDSETTKLNVKKVFIAYKTAAEYKSLLGSPGQISHPLAWAAHWYKKVCKTEYAINYFGNFSKANLLDFQANEEIIYFWVYMSE